MFPRSGSLRRGCRRAFLIAQFRCSAQLASPRIRRSPWTWGRALRFIDGPDEVHLRTVARAELKKSIAAY
jgi:hypothetical protein